MKELTLGELSELGKMLAAVSLKKIDIPEKILIPNWCAALANAKLDLGQKEYLYPDLSKATGLVRLEKKKHGIEFTVYRNGAFGFAFVGAKTPHASRSDEANPIERVRAFFLFHQFRREICERLAAAIQKEAPEHNAAMEKIGEALDTFAPYLIADLLMTWEE